MDDKNLKYKIESATLRRLIKHLQDNTDLQNIDLMNLAGFCRNCISKWIVEEAKKNNLDLDYDHLDINESDYSNQKNVVVDCVKQALAYIEQPDPVDQKIQLKALVKQAKTWDTEYGLDARTLYPELREIFDHNGY